MQLRAHTKRTVPVKLTRRARRHLSRGRPLPTRLTLTFRDPEAGRSSKPTESRSAEEAPVRPAVAAVALILVLVLADAAVASDEAVR